MTQDKNQDIEEQVNTFLHAFVKSELLVML